jgi:cysteine-rich repeat protein
MATSLLPRVQSSALVGPCALFLGASLAAACSLDAQGVSYSGGVSGINGSSTSAGAGGSGGVGGTASTSSGASTSDGAGGMTGGAGGGNGAASSGASGAGGAGGSGGAGGGTTSICGDMITHPDEECDDGNTNGNDGCSPMCKLECLPPAVEDPATKHCYVLVTQGKSWNAATTACPEGFYLATITTPQEMNVVDGISTTDTWIGAQKVNGSWTWITGEPWSYEPWEMNQPDGDGDCAELGCPADNDKSVLNDLPCGDSQPFLCERSPLAP